MARLRARPARARRERLAALIPGCELVTIPAGHRVHDARPAEFNAVVTSFLRRPGDALRSVAT